MAKQHVNEGWKEVSKTEFFHAIGPKDVTPVPTGAWPYLSLFKDKLGNVHGKIQAGDPNNTYYLPA